MSVKHTKKTDISIRYWCNFTIIFHSFRGRGEIQINGNILQVKQMYLFQKFIVICWYEQNWFKLQMNCPNNYSSNACFMYTTAVLSEKHSLRLSLCLPPQVSCLRLMINLKRVIWDKSSKVTKKSTLMSSELLNPRNMHSKCEYCTLYQWKVTGKLVGIQMYMPADLKQCSQSLDLRLQKLMAALFEACKSAN